MKSEPQKEHAWLNKVVGEWTSEAECDMGPGQPRSKTKGSEHVRAIGDLWILAEGQGEMPDGAPATMLLTLGYDPYKKRFVGTWVGSMMTHLWVYDGELDEAGKVLTLNTEGPSFGNPEKLAKYREVIEFKSDDHRTFSSSTLRDDGTWHTFMMADYRRKK